MPKWTKPAEGLPECEAGDRVLLIVHERTNRQSVRKTRRLVILEATETGWISADPIYDGYTPHDAELWSMERDVCQIASIVE